MTQQHVERRMFGGIFSTIFIIILKFKLLKFDERKEISLDCRFQKLTSASSSTMITVTLRGRDLMKKLGVILDLKITIGHMTTYIMHSVSQANHQS